MTQAEFHDWLMRLHEATHMTHHTLAAIIARMQSQPDGWTTEGDAMSQPIEGNNLLDACCPVGDNPHACHPGRLWSLWDMVVRFGEILHVATLIRAEAQRFHDTPEMNRTDFGRCVGEWVNVLAKTGPYPPPYFKGTVTMLGTLERLCFTEIANAEFGARLMMAADLLEAEGRGVWVEAIPQEKVRHFFLPGFGDETKQAFPSAQPELIEADYCYVYARSTACVFHLMRAVEHGLRALAVAVNRPVGKLPLEYEEWGTVIDGVDKEWRTCVDGWGKSAEQMNARQFFKRLVADLHAFKDDVRNTTAHTRRTYDEPGALSVRNSAEAWFSILATKVREDMSPGAVLDRTLFAP